MMKRIMMVSNNHNRSLQPKLQDDARLAWPPFEQSRQSQRSFPRDCSVLSSIHGTSILDFSLAAGFTRAGSVVTISFQVEALSYEPETHHDHEDIGRCVYDLM